MLLSSEILASHICDGSVIHFGETTLEPTRSIFFSGQDRPAGWCDVYMWSKSGERKAGTALAHF